MRSFFICICLFFSCSLTIVAQEKREELQLLVSPDEKNIAVALIDNKPFLMKMSDVRLIKSDIIQSIKIVPPKSGVFNKVQNSYQEYTKNMDCVFDIKLKEGTSLPEEFSGKVIKEPKNKKNPESSRN